MEGFDEFFKALDETTLNLGEKRKLIAKSLREAGELVAEEYRMRIPVLTGRAKESVGVSVVGQTATGAEAQIGPRMFYPKFEEFGTSRQTGHPTLGPSFDAKEDEALEKIAEILGDGIEESYNDG
jgi:HK97 gp10 family phage protein